MKKFFTFIAVAAMAVAAQANTLTVGKGVYYSNVQPLCGLYADTEGTFSQIIYPSDSLAQMAGNQITEVTFYTLNDYYVNQGTTSTDVTDFINFDDATFQLSFLEVDENGFETPVAVVGVTPVATVTPLRGDYMVTFVLDEPFAYTGKNLLVEVSCIVGGSYGQTYFFGGAVEGYTCSMYSVDGNVDVTSFLPKATFTYEAGQAPVDPTQACAKPEGGYVNGTDFHGVLVTLINNETAEGTEIHYNITLNDELIVEDAIYDDAFALTVDGDYYIDFWATAPGMLDSTHGGLIFTIDPTTGLSEMNADKAVAGVRYFNVAGQEMQQPQGLTIVLTTYTDGTTSAAKVIK